MPAAVEADVKAHPKESSLEIFQPLQEKSQLSDHKFIYNHPPTLTMAKEKSEKKEKKEKKEKRSEADGVKKVKKEKKDKKPKADKGKKQLAALLHDFQAKFAVDSESPPPTAANGVKKDVEMDEEV